MLLKKHFRTHTWPGYLELVEYNILLRYLYSGPLCQKVIYDLSTLIFIGIRDEWYTKTFYSPSFYTKVDALLDEHFMNKLGLNVSGYVQSSLEKYVGKSLEYLIK